MNNQQASEAAPVYNTFAYGQYMQPDNVAPLIPTNAGAAPSQEQITEYALQILSTRTRAVTSAVLNAVGTVCRYLSYGCALAFASNYYAQQYHHINTRLPVQFMRYYTNKSEYTTSDHLNYYVTSNVDSYMQDIRSSMRTGGVILAATVAFWMVGKGLRKAAQAIIGKPKSN